MRFKHVKLISSKTNVSGSGALAAFRWNKVRQYEGACIISESPREVEVEQRNRRSWSTSSGIRDAHARTHEFVNTVSSIRSKTSLPRMHGGALCGLGGADGANYERDQSRSSGNPYTSLPTNAA